LNGGQATYGWGLTGYWGYLNEQHSGQLITAGTGSAEAKIVGFQDFLAMKSIEWYKLNTAATST